MLCQSSLVLSRCSSVLRFAHPSRPCRPPPPPSVAPSIAYALLVACAMCRTVPVRLPPVTPPHVVPQHVAARYITIVFLCIVSPWSCCCGRASVRTGRWGAMREDAHAGRWVGMRSSVQCGCTGRRRRGVRMCARGQMRHRIAAIAADTSASPWGLALVRATCKQNLISKQRKSDLPCHRRKSKLTGKRDDEPIIRHHSK